MADERSKPTCLEELEPGAMLIKYRMESGPSIKRNLTAVSSKINTMGKYACVWVTSKALIFMLVPHSPFYREQLMNPVQQTIGKRTFHRTSLDPATFFAELDEKQQKSTSESEPLLPEEPRLPSAKKQRLNTKPPSSPTDEYPTLVPPQEAEPKRRCLHDTESSAEDTNPLDVEDPQTGETSETVSKSQQSKTPITELQTQETAQSIQENQQFITHTDRRKWRPRRHPANNTRPPRATGHTNCSTVLLRPVGNANLHKIPGSQMFREIKSWSSTDIDHRLISQGGLAVDLADNTNIDKILALTTFCGLPVTCTLAKPRSETTPRPEGLFRGPYTSAAEVREIYELDQNNPPVSNIRKLGTTNAFQISFCNFPLPDFIHLFHRQHKIVKYYHGPIQCANCLRWGHYAKDCRSATFCSKCAIKGHKWTECTNPRTKCVNCGKDHLANDKNCEHRIFAVKVAKTAASEHIPTQEARTLVSKSYAEAVKTTNKASHAKQAGNGVPTALPPSQSNHTATQASSVEPLTPPRLQIPQIQLTISEVVSSIMKVLEKHIPSLLFRNNSTTCLQEPLTDAINAALQQYYTDPLHSKPQNGQEN